MKTATLAMAVVIAAAATPAQSADLWRMYKCVGSSGETAYADRHVGTACRELWLKPTGNSGWSITDPDTVQTAEPMQPPSAVRATLNPPLPGELR